MQPREGSPDSLDILFEKVSSSEYEETIKHFKIEFNVDSPIEYPILVKSNYITGKSIKVDGQRNIITFIIPDKPSGFEIPLKLYLFDEDRKKSIGNKNVYLLLLTKKTQTANWIISEDFYFTFTFKVIDVILNRDITFRNQDLLVLHQGLPNKTLDKTYLNYKREKFLMGTTKDLPHKRQVSLFRSENPRQQKLAVKEVPYKATARKEQLVDEGKFMAGLEHPNILQVYEHGVDEEESLRSRRPDNIRKIYWVATEYMTGGDLIDFMDWSASYDNSNFQLVMIEDYVRRFIYQTLKALNYLHIHDKIAHRDIKPDNIFISADYSQAKLADFGLSKRIDPKRKFKSGEVGTEGYFPPEIKNNQEYTELCDLWSLGVTAWVLLTGREPTHQKKWDDVFYPNLITVLRNTNVKKISSEKMRELYDNRTLLYYINDDDYRQLSKDENKQKTAQQRAKVIDAKRDLLCFGPFDNEQYYHPDGFPYAFEFILKCLQPERQRISAKEALDLPWFKVEREAEQLTDQRLFDHMVQVYSDSIPDAQKTIAERIMMTYLTNRLSIYSPGRIQKGEEHATLTMKQRIDLFNAIDTDYNGVITLTEFVEKIFSVTHVDKSILQKLFKKLTSAKNPSHITYSDFCTPFLSYSREDSLMVFAALDKNGDGFLTEEDFVHLHARKKKIKTKNFTHDDDDDGENNENNENNENSHDSIQLYKMLEDEADEDHDHQISPDEFVKATNT